jgi:hypothetical protein
LQHIVTDFGVQVVPNGQMLDYFRAGRSKVKVKIQKADGVEFGNVEVVLLSLLRKVSYCHAKVVECSAYEMFLLINLDFHNEPCACGIFAIDIKHRFAVELSFTELLSAQYAHLFNWAFKPVGEECVQKEQKEFRASLIGECFLESEIQSERGELRKFFNATGRASLGNRHKTSFEGNTIKGNKTVYNKWRRCHRCKNINIENPLRNGAKPCQAPPP